MPREQTVSVANEIKIATVFRDGKDMTLAPLELNIVVMAIYNVEWEWVVPRGSSGETPRKRCLSTAVDLPAGFLVMKGRITEADSTIAMSGNIPANGSGNQLPIGASLHTHIVSH